MNYEKEILNLTLLYSPQLISSVFTLIPESTVSYHKISILLRLTLNKLYSHKFHCIRQGYFIYIQLEKEIMDELCEAHWEVA